MIAAVSRNLEIEYILKPENIIKYRNYILNNYPHLDVEQRSVALAKVIQRLVDVELIAFFNEIQREQIRQQALGRMVTSGEFLLSRNDLLFAALDAAAVHGFHFVEPLTQWINSRQDIEVDIETIEAIVEFLQADVLTSVPEPSATRLYGSIRRGLLQAEQAWRAKLPDHTFDENQIEKAAEIEKTETAKKSEKVAEIIEEDRISRTFGDSVGIEEEETAGESEKVVEIVEEPEMNGVPGGIAENETSGTMPEEACNSLDHNLVKKRLKPISDPVFTQRFKEGRAKSANHSQVAINAEQPESFWDTWGIYRRQKNYREWLSNKKVQNLAAAVVIGAFCLAPILKPTEAWNITNIINGNLFFDRTKYEYVLQNNIKPTVLVMPYDLPINFRYQEVDEQRLRDYLNNKNSILGEEPYFSSIIKAGNSYDVNPLLLFAITGQEQAFVPRSQNESFLAANNPFNVYGSWRKFNTSITNSANIAAGTVLELSKGRPVNVDPLEWINRKYAKDKSWNNGVRYFWAEMEKYLQKSTISANNV